MTIALRGIERALRMMWLTLAVAMLLLTSAYSVSAQCADPVTHFRGGVWKQWILQIVPGPDAMAAVQRILAEINQARTGAGLPVLVFDPEEVLAVGVIEENNPRGPDGANLVDRVPNQEIFLATFAGLGDGSVVVFLTDPLRSRPELTGKGVPGTPAVFERSIKIAQGDSDAGVNTKWLATSDHARVKFHAKYPEAAITFRSRFPGSSAYLSCNVAKSVDVLFRSLPTKTFGFYERNQVSLLLDLTLPEVEIKLHVRHPDRDVDTIFNDPANQLFALFELDRVVRLERQ